MRLPSLPRSLYLLALTSLFGDISTEMLYPVLPLFITRELGAPASVVGIIEGVAEATQNLAQGASGWLADRAGRNKPIALFGYALAALAKPTIALASAWPSVLVSRFADRAGAGIRSAPRDALIASSVDRARRGAAFGLEGIGDNLGAVGGPLLAAALLYLFQVDLRVIFLVAFLPGAVAFLLMTFVPETSRPPVNTALARPTALPREYWTYLATVAVFGIGNASSAFIVLRAADVGLPPELALLVYAGYNLVAALAAYPAGELSDTVGRTTAMSAALFLIAVAFAGLAFASSGWLVALLFALYGVHRGALRAVGKALAVDLVPGELRATGVGLYSGTLGLTALVAGPVAGYLWDAAGPSTTFGYGAVCAFLGGLGVLRFVRVTSR